MKSRDGVLLVLAMVAAASCGSSSSGSGSPATTSTTSAATGGSGGSGGSAGSTSVTGSSGSTGASGSTGTGTGGAGGGMGRPSDVPTSESAADIGTFLKAGGYKTAPWVSDVAAPRPGAAGTQHGDNVRVWMNAEMVTSLKAGHNGLAPAPPVDQWAMAVKEMYDAGALVGLAASFKTAAGSATTGWTYYCYAPGDRCASGMTGTEAMPIFGTGNKAPASGCGFCHGYSVYTKPPM